MFSINIKPCIKINPGGACKGDLLKYIKSIITKRVTKKEQDLNATLKDPSKKAWTRAEIIPKINKITLITR